jgi:hypothetical protein
LSFGAYPLTITDFASRCLLCCDALATTKETYAFTVFERAFKDFGLPLAIRIASGLAPALFSTSSPAAQRTALDGATISEASRGQNTGGSG